MTESIASKIISMMSIRNGKAPLFDLNREFYEPDLSLPIEEAPYVVLDTELTGLDSKRDSIVSIGAVVLRGCRIEVNNTFYRLVEPRTALRRSSIVVHGITPSEALTGDPIDTVLPELVDFCGNRIVVGHVISIDLAFLNQDLMRVYGKKLPNPAVDTHKINLWLRSRDADAWYHDDHAAGTALFDLAGRYGIPVAGAHNALNDAFMTAQLFQRFLKKTSKWGIKTVRELMRIGSP